MNSEVNISSQVKNTYLTYTYELNCLQLIWLALQKIRLAIVRMVNASKFEQLLSCSLKVPGLDNPLVPLSMTSFRECIHLLFEKLSINLHLVSEESEIQHIKKNLCESLSSFEKKVVIHAPFFTEENSRDGYVQRIKKIDELLFHDFLRIYVMEDGKHSPFISIKKINEKCYFVEYNSHCKQQREFIINLIKKSHLQYIHSLNRLYPVSVNQKMCDILGLEDVRTVWDVHGAVPEEHAMCGDITMVNRVNDTERMLYQFSDVIVVVNQATANHLEKKHGKTSARIVLLPIFNILVEKNENIDSDREEILEKFESDKPKIVYCGGTQKWQNIDLMHEVVQQTSFDYQYHFLVPNPNELISSWGNELPKDVVIESKSPEEVPTVLRNSCFGFLLRDDCAVNRVSCPTKLLEYIRSYVIPVLKSPYIGDFKELGLNYFDYNLLLNHSLPGKEVCMEYAINNYNILQRIHEQFENGISALSAYLSGIE